MFRRPATIALALTSSIAIMACNPAPTPQPAATVTGVTVTATPATIKVNETTTVKAVATGTNSPAQTFTFKSSNDAVATVTAAGLVTGKSVGTADITATSTVNTTKFAVITIKVEAADTTPGLTTAKVNFQTAAATTPVGYTANTGAAYTAASMTGWVTEASAGTATPVPLDLTNNARNRVVDGTNVVAGGDARQYTQIQMQCGSPTTGNTCNAPATNDPGAFEYKVVNGKYNVTVSVGDADKRNLNSSHTINVEGTNAISKFVPTLAGQFKSATVMVTVADGKLTIDAKGGQNTKLNYVDIVPAN
ncbi:Ig-like domain-containing protein [Deinococcus aerolatus]|nr:Ig-like domain-containing protein [Deinococcus aerolatus]